MSLQLLISQINAAETEADQIEILIEAMEGMIESVIGKMLAVQKTDDIQEIDVTQYRAEIINETKSDMRTKFKLLMGGKK